jgi:hypothetical protein
MQLARKQARRNALAGSARSRGAVFTAVAAAALSMLAMASAAAPARASTPSDYISEIITPAGWEVRPTSEHCGWRDVAGSAEIVTPSAWSKHSGREEPTWSGCSCSDLVVPLEWGKSVRQ